MPIILALMFNEVTNQLFKRTAQTIVYLPHFISTVIIAGIVITAFSPTAGVVNTVLEWFGFEPIYFSNQTRMVPTDFHRFWHLARGRVFVHRVLGRHRRREPVPVRIRRS